MCVRGMTEEIVRERTMEHRRETGNERTRGQGVGGRERESERENKKEVCTHGSVNIYRIYTNIKLQSCTCEPKIYIYGTYSCVTHGECSIRISMGSTQKTPSHTHGQFAQVRGGTHGTYNCLRLLSLAKTPFGMVAM